MPLNSSTRRLRSRTSCSPRFAGAAGGGASYTEGVNGLTTILALPAAAAVATWCYLVGARGFFWRAGSQLIPPADALPRGGRVAVVIPARNETEGIGLCIESLLRQSFRGSLEIVLVDDASTDGTAKAAREAARQAGAESRLTVIEGRRLPDGWSGKLWAVQQGIEHVLNTAQQPDFILLTDADIVHAPESLQTLVATAERGGYELTSVMVRLQCRTRAEKLLIPAFVFFFFMLYPPRWIADARQKAAGAAGGCMLVRPAALAAAGGMEAIRGEIIDDCALAGLIKRRGGRVYLGLATETVSLRSYASWDEIGNMIARTAFNQLRHSAWLLAGSLLGLTLTYLLPVISLLFGVATGQAGPALLGGAAWLLMFAAYWPMVRFYGLNPLWAAALPLAAGFYMGATFVSAARYWSGRGGQWKGRAQDMAKK